MPTQVKRTLAALGLAAAMGAAGSYVVTADGGGNVLSYVYKYDDLERRNVPVIIAGQCNSSCTMALGYKNACLEPKAVLGFHPSYTPLYFGYVLNPPGTNLMLAHYPPDARAVIDRHGDLLHDPGPDFSWQIGVHPKLFYVKATEFPEHYLCRS